jgi:hypothetical protein
MVAPAPDLRTVNSAMFLPLGLDALFGPYFFPALVSG